MRRLYLLLPILLLAGVVGVSQDGPVNFNAIFKGSVTAIDAVSTAPLKTGTSLPGSCTVGQMYFKSDVTAGQNLHLCTATNTWTQVTGGGGGGGGAGATSGAIASRPSPGTAGRTYLALDSWYTNIMDNGSSWEYFAGFSRVTPPVSANFATQGTITATPQTNGAIVLTSTGNSGYYEMTAPGAPYTKTFVMVCNYNSSISGNYNGCGVDFRESGTQKVLSCQIGHDGGSAVNKLRCDKYSSNGAVYDGNVTGSTTSDSYMSDMMPFRFWRLARSGSTLTVSVSFDLGQTWISWYSDTLTNTGFTTTADKLGVVISSTNNLVTVAFVGLD